MALRFPASKNTPLNRLRYALRWKERVRLIHNLMGLWTRDGLTRAQYDNGVDSGLLGGVPGVTVVIPTIIQNQFAYVAKLPRGQFRAWQSSTAPGGFERMHSLARDASSIEQSTLEEDTTEDADIDVNKQEL